MKSLHEYNSPYQGLRAPTTNFRKLRKVFGLAIAAIGLSASIMSAQAIEYVAATGGTVTTYNSLGTIYTVHTFTGSGTFTVTTGGTVNYLVIGGGGGGGSGTGGGGGAGGFLESTATVTGGSTAYTVTVGTGGPGGTANNAGSAGWGSTGNPSSFDVFVTASGGGGGAPNSTTLAANGNAGGSGGGGSWGTPGAASTGGAATPSGQGNAGGACLDWNGPYAAGGGGGAGAVGVAGNKQNPGAAGGAGKASSIRGTSTTYAGGGGGGAFNTTGGTGGTGGGGNGGKSNGGATAGAANTGSGGGGQGGNKTGAGAGGSGIVIISYASGTSPNPTSTSATLEVAENTATALATGNFGYADPNSSPLTAVQITTLPALGTLKLSGTAVTLNQIVAVADIPNLTYQSALPTYGTGAAYTTIGIKVENSNSLWSDPAVMTVNVTPTLPVQIGSFETPGANNIPDLWAGVAAPWTHSGGVWGQVARSSLSLPDNGGGTWVANFNDAGIVITQPLGSHSFNAGDTLSVTFDIGRLNNSGGIFEAIFRVNGTPYSETFTSSAQGVNTWASHTLTKILPAAVSGNVTLEFRWVSGQVGELDKVSNVSVTASSVNPNAPLSTAATLTVLEDVETALAAGDFGYSDPNNSALAAVQITSLPALGTLKLSGTPVVIGDLPLTVAAANIGTLTYLAATNANGAPYTVIGIKVENSTSLWSIPSEMTVNVTPVNDAPTSTGGSVILRTDTVKAFAASNFQYSDVEGSPLSAIKVTSLPTHGTLKLGETSVVLDDVIPVASIPTLTYTSNTGYIGADSFNFQVSDGELFSTDASMAITVMADILVLNGSFEDPTPHNPNNGSNADWTAGGWAFLPAPWTSSYAGPYNRISSAAMVGTAQPGPWICNLNGSIWIKQDLGTTVNAGDILSVTCQVMSDTKPGILEVSFLVGSGPTVYSQIFTNPVNNNVWVSYTLTKEIEAGVSGNLILKISNVGVTDVSDRLWLDLVSNVSSRPAPPRGTVIILW